MLQSQANWKFTYNERDMEIDLKQGLSVSSLAERLLFQRGIITVEQADKFLKPQLSHLHDPSLLNDIDKAANRVKQAIANKESVLVFGDYDADGVSATTVLLEALREAGANCTYHIPNRFTEGYGPNEQAFRKAEQHGISLIITVDTGIAAVHEAEIAKQLGIDLIITDHHEVQENLPDAYAIVHPKCSTEYPFQELAGVGVAFKFAQHLLGYFPEHLLDLVVIGTIADLVPLVNENRVLAYYGLKAISNSKRAGIKALKNVCNIEGAVTEEHIGFMIGPRINAVGRLQDANMAVDLLLSGDPEEASELADFIEQLNQERQKIVAEIAEQAAAMVKNDETGQNDHVIVVAKEGWNEGVLGIVASKLVRMYDRPAIVLSINREKGQAKGSARSIEAFDLFTNCMTIRETFLHFGGHAQAAGMTLPIENITELRSRLNEVAANQLSPEDYKQVLEVSSSVEIEDLNLSVIKEVDSLGPFGMGNPKPLFHLRTVPAEVRKIGSQKNHLKFTFQNDTKQLDGIAFGMGGLFPKIAPRSTMDVIGELGINEWNGKQKIQLMIKDISINEWQLFDFRGSKHWQQQIPAGILQESTAVYFRENSKDALPGNISSFLYEKTNTTKLKKSSDLLLLDMPVRLEDLISVLVAVKPKRIYACYYESNSQYLSSLPSREDFKWFYAMLAKRGKFNKQTEINKLSLHKGWKPEKIDFIIQVFFELEFVKIDNGLVTVNANPSKKELTEAQAYQEKQTQLEIEETLYYSSYNELKTWFDQYMKPSGSPKEEVTNGL